MKISELARNSGVPAATIKYYVREGLLPGPVKKGRNIAYYDPAIITRIQAIKELQKKRFLPLNIIREVLDGADPYSGDETEKALAKALNAMQPPEQRTRRELLDSGLPAEQLDFFEEVGFITPKGEGDGRVYEGDDLQLLRTLGAARRAGLSPEMLPYTTVVPYLKAIQQLVRVELDMFRAGLAQGRTKLAQGRTGLAHARNGSMHAEGEGESGAPDKSVAELVQAATELSERLVILLRRKLLLPTLRQIARESEEAQNNEAHNNGKHTRRETGKA